MDDAVLIGARVSNGLLAGIYAAFLLAVAPALHSQGDQVFTTVFTRINVVIVNPAFLLLFLGAPLLAAAHLGWHRGSYEWVAAGAAAVALMVTFAANIPLNDALADGGSRADFETPWLIWHSVRTAAMLVAFGALSRP